MKETIRKLWQISWNSSSELESCSPETVKRSTAGHASGEQIRRAEDLGTAALPQGLRADEEELCGGCWSTVRMWLWTRGVTWRRSARCSSRRWRWSTRRCVRQWPSNAICIELFAHKFGEYSSNSASLNYGSKNTVCCSWQWPFGDRGSKNDCRMRVRVAVRRRKRTRRVIQTEKSSRLGVIESEGRKAEINFY